MQAQPVPPWREHSRNRPHHPLDAQPVPSVDSQSIEPIILDDATELDEDTQNAEDAEMDDAANPEDAIQMLAAVAAKAIHSLLLEKRRSV